MEKEKMESLSCCDCGTANYFHKGLPKRFYYEY
ncbi:hypothetical protein SAMN05443529_13136 [Desulfosporosinus hippei DSM 8344]|uniref:Uncharacterized protein n=1 Tax=Desulfosporosinus hippei DSM 8344 TaxID=1121419 RepID=A0A1G8J6J5_9FIRM|nr:hypothetical protein SAMN05443529_13136 [Desulfosporosinus hippei DSM 8344]